MLYTIFELNFNHSVFLCDNLIDITLFQASAAHNHNFLRIVLLNKRTEDVRVLQTIFELNFNHSVFLFDNLIDITLFQASPTHN